MASIPVASDTASLDATRRSDLIGTVYRYVLWPLASLKLTVMLFALAIVVILVGTLAQVEMDIWQVLEDYFKPWVTRVDVPLFFPRSWFPQRDPVQVARVRLDDDGSQSALRHDDHGEFRVSRGGRFPARDGHRRCGWSARSCFVAA